MRNFAIIPARGGSKRIPGKNIREFCGQPIISWSIQAALESQLFDDVLISTDDPRIAEVAQQFGASVPFLRPPELADDLTPTIPVVRHAIEELANRAPDTVACIYPTAPFLTAQVLKQAYRQVIEHPDCYIFACTKYDFPVQRSFTLDANGGSVMREPDKYFARSQDLEPVFHDAGQFYWASTTTWATRDVFYDPGRPIVLSHDQVQDIDTSDDWAQAELKFRRLRPDAT